ncbi:MAG: S8 family peptidase [Candidatus Kapabacteria bacterium]|nr:S8 family peptidase [Ignavibacteriota bacterium]MCW5885854.1 S8 family peptidase [Candidatus Kapabacteria bacterium]
MKRSILFLYIFSIFGANIFPVFSYYPKFEYSNKYFDFMDYSKLIVKVNGFNGYDNLINHPKISNLRINSYFHINHDANPPLGSQNVYTISSYNELTKYFEIHLEDYTIKQASELADELNQMDYIQVAYFEPYPVPPSNATPDFRNRQEYFKPASLGTGYSQIKHLPGAKGSGIKYCDVEYATILDHEDFDDEKLKVANAEFSYPSTSWHDHGAAVLGIAYASENDFGIDGMIGDAEIYIAYPCYSTPNCNYNVARAILDAANILDFGDVILIEQQTNIPYPATGRYGPVEFYAASFDAIKFATEKGITVVEAGGNGGLNLDTNFLNGVFDRTVRNSGAIMVAAGSLESNRILGFSPYGSRIDLFANGEKTTTAGYGAAFNDPQAGKTRAYTHSFGGTSGASAIVAPVAVSLQGMFHAMTGAKLDPKTLRDVLYDTGTISATLDKNIGKMPNLADAYKYILDNYTSVEDNNQTDEIDITILGNSTILIANLSANLSDKSIQIFDVLGIEVIYAGAGLCVSTKRIDISHLPAGVYFVRIGIKVEKFIKM